MQKERKRLSGMRFSPNGKQIMINTKGEHIRVSEWNDFERRAKTNAPVSGKLNYLPAETRNSLQVLDSKDGKLLFTLTGFKNIKVNGSMLLTGSIDCCSLERRHYLFSNCETSFQN